MNKNKDKPKLEEKEAIAFFGTTAAGTDDDVPVFRAPFDCEILSAHVINGSDLAASGSVYLTLTLTDKGSAGTGSDSIASITTASTGFTGFLARSMGTISSTHGLLSEGDVVSLVKTHASTGSATDVMQCVIRYKRR